MKEANAALRRLAAEMRAQLPASIKNMNISLSLSEAGPDVVAIWGIAGSVTIAINATGPEGSFNVSVQTPNEGVSVHAGPLSLLPSIG